MIKKWDLIPEELQELTDETLEDSEFADDVNRIYPINDEAAIAQSFEILRDNPYNKYSRAENLYLLDRICHAAEKFEVNLDDLLESLGGEIMSDVKNTPEFAEAVKAERERLMAELADKNEHAKALQELESKISGNDKVIAELTKELETVKAEKEDLKKDFDEYKSDVETKAKIRDRVDELKAVGMNQEDWTETEEAVAEMSDKVFALFKSKVAESIKAELHMDEEKKKKMEEEMKKKKKEAKASTDIVDESKQEGPLPNTENKEEDEFPFLSRAFDRRKKFGY